MLATPDKPMISNRKPSPNTDTGQMLCGTFFTLVPTSIQYFRHGGVLGPPRLSAGLSPFVSSPKIEHTDGNNSGTGPPNSLGGQMIVTQSLLFLIRAWRDRRGQDLIEYALMAGFVAVAAGAIMPNVASSISTIFSSIASVMAGAAIQGS